MIQYFALFFVNFPIVPPNQMWLDISYWFCLVEKCFEAFEDRSDIFFGCSHAPLVLVGSLVVVISFKGEFNLESAFLKEIVFGFGIKIHELSLLALKL